MQARHLYHRVLLKTVAVSESLKTQIQEVRERLETIDVVLPSLSGCQKTGFMCAQTVLCICRMALSDAKSDVDDRVRDLAAAERELEKADFDLRYKTHEAKIVNKAAVAKRTEVCSLLLSSLAILSILIEIIMHASQG